MRPPPSLLPTTGLAVLICAGGGCAEEHSRLAPDDAGTGAATTTTGSAGTGGGGGSSTGAGGAGGDPEPPGPTVVTVVNGVVDANAIRLCFPSFPGGAGADPWPSVGGLGFARAGRIDPVSPTVPNGQDVEVLVVGGDLAQTAGQSCADLAAMTPNDAGPPVRVESAGVIPQSVFATERSLLIALSGCLGGADHDHEAVEQICGVGYQPSSPNVAMSVGFLSRQTSPDHVGMQFCHASQATPTSYLRLAPGIDGAVAQLVVPSWSLGAIAPYPPLWRFSRAGLGAVPEATLELSTNVSTPEHRASFAEALSNSELTATDLVEGVGFTFVMVGASHTMGPDPGPWWHELSYTVLRSDP